MYFDAPFFVNYSNKFIQILSNVCKIGKDWRDFKILLFHQIAPTLYILLEPY